MARSSCQIIRSPRLSPKAALRTSCESVRIYGRGPRLAAATDLRQPCRAHATRRRPSQVYPARGQGCRDRWPADPDRRERSERGPKRRGSQTMNTSAVLLGGRDQIPMHADQQVRDLNTGSARSAPSRTNDLDLRSLVCWARLGSIADGMSSPAHHSPTRSQAQRRHSSRSRTAPVVKRRMRRDARSTPTRTETTHGPTDPVGAPEWYSDEFGRLLRRAGLRRITLHDSRHTTLTLSCTRACPSRS